MAETTSVEAKVFTVKDIAIEGKCYYFLFNETQDLEFFGYSDQLPKIKWVKKGQKISVVANIGNGETQIPIVSIE